MKGGLHKVEAALGVEVLVTDKKIGFVEEEIGHIEVEIVLRWEGIVFDEKKIDDR